MVHQAELLVLEQVPGWQYVQFVDPQNDANYPMLQMMNEVIPKLGHFVPKGHRIGIKAEEEFVQQPGVVY